MIEPITLISLVVAGLLFGLFLLIAIYRAVNGVVDYRSMIKNMKQEQSLRFLRELQQRTENAKPFRNTPYKNFEEFQRHNKGGLVKPIRFTALPCAGLHGFG